MILKGKLASTQLVGTFGVGSLYDLRIYAHKGQKVTSVSIAGLDEWDKFAREFTEISEPVLEKALRVDHLLEPPSCPDDMSRNTDRFDGPWVPIVRFPVWLACNKCNRLGKVGAQFSISKGANACRANRCSGHGVPVRLVTTCFGSKKNGDQNSPHPGHIDEFPWHWWAHSYEKESTCMEATSELFLSRNGTSAALSGLRVYCRSQTCRAGKVGRSLDGVFGENALSRQTCGGARPWLGDSENCTRRIRTLMRGASNVYFPVTASALSIPPTSTDCKQAVKEIWQRTVKPAMDAGVVGSVLASIAQNASPKLQRYTTQQVLDVIGAIAHPAGEGGNLPETDAEQRILERRAIVDGLSDQNSAGTTLFQSERINPTHIAKGGALLASHVGSLSLVHRLREVKVLRGFTRLQQTTGDPYTSQCAPIWKGFAKWLPAIQIYGEGIHFELDPDRLHAWGAKTNVLKRVSVINDRYAGVRPNDNHARITPEFILVHTLSHLLINQLGLDCGYSSSSLREKIYVGMEEGGIRWAGALIYTATSCADGTLGGLVRQGNPDLFGATLRIAIENAKWCSSDPLCVESKGQGVDALNFAACHACAIVSETSCEHRNVFLDRALIVGTLDDPFLGFFGGDSGT